MRRYQIVAVCLGNICRSPMAEAVLKSQLAEAGLAELVEVSSGGTGDWHVGAGADVRAVSALRRHGHELIHTARQVDIDWFDDADLVLAMDRANLATLRRIVGDTEAVERVRLLRSFDPELTHLPDNDPGLDVPDPYYGGDVEFDRTLVMIEQASVGVVDQVRLDLYDY